MGMKKIYCEVHSDEKRIYYIDEYLKVWPCCYFSQTYKPIMPKENISITDDMFNNKNKDHPDWNDLKKRKFSDIIKDKLFTEYTFYDGWENNPSPICLENCTSGNHLL